MSLSAVDPSSIPANKWISTHIAFSDDAGWSWTEDGVVNAASDVSLPLAPPNDQGTWTHEVSRIVYDAAGPVEARWLLLWHRVLVVNGSRLFEHSWIGLKTANTPAPSDWSSERKLFVGSTYATSDDSIIGAPEVRLAQLHPDLANCAVPTEPGVLAAADGIYVTLYCAATNPADGRQVLLRRSRTTSSWEYLGSFTTNADAQAMGFDDFSATDLVEDGGQKYFLVSPELAGSYQGCMAFSVQDLSTASLVRTGNPPLPAVHRWIKLELGGTGFGGACGYHSANRGGILYSALFSDTPPFRMFMTFERP